MTTVGEKESTERNESESESEIQTYIVINLIFNLFFVLIVSSHSSLCCWIGSFTLEPLAFEPFNSPCQLLFE